MHSLTHSSMYYSFADKLGLGERLHDVIGTTLKLIQVPQALMVSCVVDDIIVCGARRL